MRSISRYAHSQACWTHNARCRMTIINNSYGFVFVHIPKTAGTSLTKFLSQYTNYCDIELGVTDYGERIQNIYAKRFGISKHSSAERISSIMGEIEWQKKFSFAIVRHPTSRVLSLFNFLRTWETPDQTFNLKMRSFVDVNDFIASNYWNENDGPDGMFRPQSTWIYSAKFKKKKVDFIGKLENIQVDIATITQLAKLPIKPEVVFPRLNESKKEFLETDLTKKSIELIRKKYQVDFINFYNNKKHD